jgi:LuxR family maltose regulon positive regulatory protein
MALPLLQTKLYIPPPRPEFISRPRLIERLNAGLDRKLTLVSAPAGFGKTTLLSEWIASHRLGGPRLDGRGARHLRRPAHVHETEAVHAQGRLAPLRFAWLSLDQGDNDLTRFLSYLIAALQTVEAGIGQGLLATLQSPTPVDRESVLTHLLNEIAGLSQNVGAGPHDGRRTQGRPYVLVLDDYHVIEAPEIDQTLAFLLDHLPPPATESIGGLHLVIAGRTDPTLPLSRLRARSQLNELRTAELRFTSDEAAAFLKRTVRLPISTHDVRTLEERTEGWITGLQLAAVAMQGLGQRPDQGDQIAGFVQSFGGSHRYLID